MIGIPRSCFYAPLKSCENIVDQHMLTTCSVWLNFISLHIRSMWETICDAWACWSGWNFGPNSGRIPPILKLVQNTPLPPKMKTVRESKSERFRITPPMKIVRESKSERFRIPPQWKLSESPNPRGSEYPPHTNENCQRVQIQEVQNTPPMKIVRESKSERFRIPPTHKWKLSESPNPRGSEYPPNENCQRVQIWEVQNTPPHTNENCQRVQIQEVQNTPSNENCQRVRIREVQNIPPKWKLSESPNPRGSEYPPMKIVKESKSERFRIPPQMKIVRESKSERLRIPGRSMWKLICNPRDTARLLSWTENSHRI